MEPVGRPIRAEIRLLHVEIKRIAQAIGIASLAYLDDWGTGGDGRAVKESTEKLSRLLSAAPAFIITSRQQFEIIDELVSIRKNEFFLRFLSNLPSKRKNGPKSLIEWLDHFGDRLTVLAKQISIEEADFALEQTQRLAALREEELRASLEEIPVEQKIGPIQFGFSGGILRLVNPESEIDLEDRVSVENAKDALLAIASVLLADMRAANCDKRFIITIEQLEADLRTSDNIILLGLNASVHQAIAGRLADELSDVVSGRLDVFLAGLQMYVSQFETWRKFSHNALMANITRSEIDVARDAGKALLSELRAAETAVDPVIERKLSGLVAAADNPATVNSKISYSIITTVTNFIAVVFKTSATAIGDILDAAKEGVADGVKSGASKGASIAVLTMFGASTVALYQYISPTTAKAIGAEWLPRAIEALQEALKAAG